jgi:ABC-2 type transport system permease protein
MVNLLGFEIRIRRGTIISWGLGLAGFAFIYLPFYPSVVDQFSGINFEEIALYQALGSFNMATFEGYFASTVLQFFAVIFAIYAVVNGTATLAGEEDAGTLELLAAMPLKRWHIVVAKALAMIVSGVFILAIASVFVMLAVSLVAAQVEVGITPLEAVPAVWNSLPITICFMMISLFLGALLPNRRIAAAAGTVIVIASYFGNNLAGMIPGLESIKPFVPFNYYNASPDLFTDGIPWGDTFVLLAAAGVFLLLAILAFQRRSLTTGAWPWQRNRAK